MIGVQQVQHQPSLLQQQTYNYITISSTGNASDFGDLNSGRMSPGAASGGDAA